MGELRFVCCHSKVFLDDTLSRCLEEGVFQNLIFLWNFWRLLPERSRPSLLCSFRSITHTSNAIRKQ